MIANVAFLAALTTFLAVAWLAGELSFLAPFKAGLFRHHGLTIGVGDPGVLPESLRRVLQHGPLAVPARHRPQAGAHGPATGVARRRARDLHQDLSCRSSVMWRDIDPREDERERPDLSREAAAPGPA